MEKKDATKKKGPETFDNSEFEKAIPSIDPKNMVFWERMSAKAKGIMNSMYSGLRKMPATNRLVAKLEIAYNQGRVDKKERKQARLSSEYHSLDQRDAFLEDTQKIKDEAIGMIRAEGFVSKDMIKDKKRMKKEQAELRYKKDKLQSKIEEKENEKNISANKRDACAERMIAYYNEKLGPIDARLKRLETKKDKVELICLGNEIKMGEIEDYIGDLENTKNKLIEKYEAFGYTEKAALRDSIFKEIDKQIEMHRSRIYSMTMENKIRREEVEPQIAKQSKKAEPFRNRKNQFVRVKDNRPVDFEIPKRTEPKEHTEREEVRSYIRGEYVETEEEKKADEEEPEVVTKVEQNEQKEGVETFDAWIIKFNNYIEKKKGLKKYEDLLKVDKENILKVTKLSENTKMTKENLKKVITLYYKIEKIDKDLIDKVINNFK